jgi:DNA-binding transcriptional regulator YhcF (GntR family)
MINELEIADSSQDPKYLQLAEEIVRQIDQGNLRVNERLPSVNQLSKELNISRETVFKALNYLSEKGIVKSANRRGYFIQKVNVRPQLRIFMMLDKMTAFKEELYHAFFEGIGEQGEVDVYFHHHNYRIFRSLIADNLQNYTHFVIVTFMHEDVSSILNLIPPEKRIILDCREAGLEGTYTMVYQDFAANVFTALTEATQLLRKYRQLILVVPSHISHFAEVEKGFRKFVQETAFPARICTAIDEVPFESGNVYFTLRAIDDRDMVKVIKLCRRHQLQLGREIGLITYNDTDVKEILEGGITTVAVDFKKMGELTARKILDKVRDVEVIPSKLILRSSL